MRKPFVLELLRDLKNDGTVRPEMSILTVCAGSSEREVFAKAGFEQVTISNLDERMDGRSYAPFAWSFQDAENLTFDDGSFDVVFVADGLHHCGSPHRALLEMYRVARKTVIVVESRDSATMRLANRLGLSPVYELEAVVGNNYTHGGLNNTEIPNHIYRWTEAEFKKTIRSYNPTGPHDFQFSYGLNLPFDAATYKKTSLKRNVLLVARPFLWAFTKVFKRQCNSFAMIATKPATTWPWLNASGEALRFDPAYAETHFATRK